MKAHAKIPARPQLPSPTPSTMPSPTTSAIPPSTGCASEPHSCGFPDGTNAGASGSDILKNVPAQETKGKGWAWENDHIVISAKGATVSNLNIDGWVEIDADHVTLNDINITNTGDWWGVGLYCQDKPARSKGCHGVTIENTSIGSPYATGPNRLAVAIKDVYGDAVGTRIIRVNIYHSSTGIQISNGVIEDSYIHNFGLNSADGDHLNGITVGGGDPRSLLIYHNTIFNNYAQTDAIALFQDFGPEENKTIADNLLAGGGYVMYGGAADGCNGPPSAFKCNPSSDIVVTGNEFSTMFYRSAGYYGPIANFNAKGSGNIWSGNKWADGPRAGKLVGP